MAIRIEDDVAELYGSFGRALQAVVTTIEATDAELAAKVQLDPDGALRTADGLHTAIEHRCDVFRELLAFSECRLRATVAKIQTPGLVIPFPKPEGTSGSFSASLLDTVFALEFRSTSAAVASPTRRYIEAA